MPISDQKLSTSGNAELLLRLSSDFRMMVLGGAEMTSSKRIYVINCDDEPVSVKSSARVAAFKKIAELSTIKKIAIDTRNIDQETQRNPRRNLQYWHRSQEFVDQEMQDKLEVFAKLYSVLQNIKENYEREPEYHDSYSRVLHGHVERTLRIKEGDKDFFSPQISYLEQILYSRYRISLEEIKRMSSLDIKKAILKKDEDLMKRGAYLDSTGGFNKDSNVQKNIVIDGNSSKNTQQNIVEAIFGNTDMRRDGEKKVQRTITSTIMDEVKE